MKTPNKSSSRFSVHRLEFEGFRGSFERYPLTSDPSLMPWNAADLMLLQWWKEHELSPKSSILYNDRFGVLSCCLAHDGLKVAMSYKSQWTALKINMKRYHLPAGILPVRNVLKPLEKPVDVGVFKMPKSLELFEIQLAHCHRAAQESTVVAVGFMTKYFAEGMLRVASKYFEEVEQTKAWKKARLMILKKPKAVPQATFTKELESASGKRFKQYYGVFSSSHIDYGSELLIQHLNPPSEVSAMLDLASGNGVLGYHMQKQCPSAELYLMDDNHLAVESGKLNVQGNVRHHWDSELESLGLPEGHFDWVVTNPPFHFDHENNIEVSLNLFEQVSKYLGPNGVFQLVANRHLNYSAHLKAWFRKVERVAENSKFEVINCH